MKTLLFLLVVLAVACGGDAFRFFSRRFRYRSCRDYMLVRYPACRQVPEGEICARHLMGPLIYQQRVESDKCSTGLAGEFNRTTCGYTAACIRKCESEVKYICEPSLDEKAALLVESLSLGVDAEDTPTETPTQSLVRSYSRHGFHYRGKRSHSYFRYQSRLSANETCPENPANNAVCKGICTATDTDVDHPEPSKPLEPDTPVEPFNLSEFTSLANSRKSYRCCRNEDGDRYFLFILDSSSAVGEVQFEAAKDFACNIVKQLCGSVKIALATYDSAINLEFCFNCHNTREEVCAAIDRAVYRGRNETRTASAVKCAAREILSGDCGLPVSRGYYWRVKRSNVDVVVITSGENSGPCSASLAQTIGYCQSQGYATHVITARATPSAFQLVHPHARNFTNVVVLDDLTNLLPLSEAIADRLTKTNSTGDFLYTCSRDSAQCRRQYLYRG